MATTTLTASDIEKLIYRCRMRQLKAEHHGTALEVAVYRRACDFYLELWRPACIDGVVRI